MAFTIFVLSGPTPQLNDAGQVISRAATIGIKQDAGTTYRLFIGNIPAANNTKAELRTYLNANAAEYYAEAQSRGVVMNLFVDASYGNLVKAAAEVNRARFNQLRAAIINPSTVTFADFKAVIAGTPAITAAADLQALLDAIDTDPNT
jgi:hypothetical protein